MEIKITKNYEFTPDWNGNKSDDNPIKFYCKRLTIETYEKCINLNTAGIEVDRVKLLKESILKIENFAVDGKPICDFDDFKKIEGINGLFNEVTTYILEQNNLDPPKN